MSLFEAPAIVTDANTLASNAKAVLEAELAGWDSDTDTQTSIFLEMISVVAAEQAEALRLELVAAYGGLGPLVSTPPILAQPATAIATFTLTGVLGADIDMAGVQVGIRDVEGELQAFRVPDPIIIKAGETKGSGVVEAIEAGAAGNNLAGKASIISGPETLKEVVLATSGGGEEEESEESFLERLTEALQIQRPGPVLAIDAAAIARSVPGVGRATAVDNLKPGAADGGEGVEDDEEERVVTVACRTVEGGPADAAHLLAVKEKLEGLRETNFIFYVIAGRTMNVDVATTVSAWPGYDHAVVKAEVKAALERYLSPALYATDATGDPARWSGDSTLRQAGLFSAIMNVPGVRWSSTMTFGKSGGGLSTTDLLLGGSTAVPALPLPGTITVTVEP